MIAPESRRVTLIAAGLLVFAAVYLLAGPHWFSWDAQPGSPLGQSLGIAAALVLLASLLYMPLRRSDSARMAKPRMQLRHNLAGTLGVVLAIAHSRASLREWSTLVLLAVVGLLVSGLYGRVIAPQRLGSAFGRAATPYTPAASSEPPGMSAHLAQRIEAKRALLDTLAPGAKEGQFVLRTHHWRRHPRQAFGYFRLARAEQRVLTRHAMSGTNEIGLLERLWRRLHLLFAALFVIGLIAHVITTVFFAGYVAGGREIYWWHITKW